MPPNLNPDLGGAWDIACRIKADFGPADLPRLTIYYCLKLNIAQSVAHHWGCLRGRQIVPMTGARMVCVAMGDQHPRHRLPGINVEIPGRAIDQALVKVRTASLAFSLAWIGTIAIAQA